uniref:Telomere zinc finger-associated protein-like isoform X2 n=1 Tax=Diabrotica virgifera virgifera TaxID=50390 RepID=A0A6P7FXV1_DIAVI
MNPIFKNFLTVSWKDCLNSLVIWYYGFGNMVLRSGIRNKGFVLFISENPKIPSIICSSCIDFINEIHRFIETAHNSEKVLQKLFCESNSEDVKQDPINDVPCEQKISETENDSNEYPENIQIRLSPVIFQKNKNLSVKAKDTYHEDSSDNCDELLSVRSGSTLLQTVELHSERCIYQCDICQKKFDIFFDYQDHQESHNGEFVFCCSKCSEVYANRTDLVEHENNHRVGCPICQKLVLPKSLEAHMKKHSDIFKCNICDSRHSSKAAMEKHMRARHEGLKGYICHVCGKQNSCQTSMNRHLASHLQNKPYTCNLCSFATKLETLLKVHISRKHSSEKCMCNICENWFKSKFSLKRHQNRMHNPKKYRCNHCGKHFREKFNLTQHVQSKHSKQRVYECKICHREFYTTQHLKNHMHTHRSGCVSCPKCRKVFAYKKYLEKHMIKCTGAKNKKEDVDISVIKDENE